MKNLFVDSAVWGRYRFARLQDAKDVIVRLRKLYVAARNNEQPPGKPDEVVKLWVKGYSLTPAEFAEGRMGNFVILRVVQLPGGSWGVRPEKCDVPVARHPMVFRVPKEHPDWGHPVLRAALTNRVYPEIGSARAALEMLHLQYPGCSVPGPDMLHIFVYRGRRKAEKGDPIERITVKIRPQDDGSAALYFENQKPKPPAKKADAGPAVGKFTAMVTRKKSRKPS